jgi:hypothetical protein
MSDTVRKRKNMTTIGTNALEWSSRCCSFSSTGAAPADSSRPNLLAQPEHRRSRDRARSSRFAGFILQEGPNYPLQDCSLGQILEEESKECWNICPVEQMGWLEKNVQPLEATASRPQRAPIILHLAVPFIPELYRDSELDMEHPPNVITSSYRVDPNVSAPLLQSSLAARYPAYRTVTDDDTTAKTLGPRQRHQAARFDADPSSGAGEEVRPVIRYLSV